MKHLFYLIALVLLTVSCVTSQLATQDIPQVEIPTAEQTCDLTDFFNRGTPRCHLASYNPIGLAWDWQDQAEGIACVPVSYQESDGLFNPGTYLVVCPVYGKILVRRRIHYPPNEYPFVVWQPELSDKTQQVDNMGFIDANAEIYKIK